MVTIVYNKKKYKVYQGTRGGHFIKIKGQKKYINLKERIKLSVNNKNTLKKTTPKKTTPKKTNSKKNNSKKVSQKNKLKRKKVKVYNLNNYNSNLTGGGCLNLVENKAVEQLMGRSNLQDSDFSHVEQIGEGNTATVYSARYKGTQVVLKKFKRDVDFDLQFVVFLISLNHPNIVKIYNHYHGFVSSGKKRHVIVMEFVLGIDLEKYISNRNLTSSKAEAIFYETVKGLRYLHERDIIHRDIKSQNIMICESGKLMVKIIDLDTAIICSDGKKITGISGIIHITPNVLNNSTTYDKSVDIWLLGTLYYHLLTKRLFILYFADKLNDETGLFQSFQQKLQTVYNLRVDGALQQQPKEVKQEETKNEFDDFLMFLRFNLRLTDKLSKEQVIRKYLEVCLKGFNFTIQYRTIDYVMKEEDNNSQMMISYLEVPQLNDLLQTFCEENLERNLQIEQVRQYLQKIDIVQNGLPNVLFKLILKLKQLNFLVKKFKYVLEELYDEFLDKILAKEQLKPHLETKEIEATFTQELLCAMLQKDSTKRPTIQQIYRPKRISENLVKSMGSNTNELNESKKVTIIRNWTESHTVTSFKQMLYLLTKYPNTTFNEKSLNKLFEEGLESCELNNKTYFTKEYHKFNNLRNEVEVLMKGGKKQLQKKGKRYTKINSGKKNLQKKGKTYTEIISGKKRIIYIGSKGGKYYIQNKNGKKVKKYI